jgi:hypothetical protein
MSQANAARLRRRPGLITRDLGASVVVLDRERQTAHTLRDEAAELWRAASDPRGVPTGPMPVAAQLVDKELLVPVGMTRRAVLGRLTTVGALVAGASLVDSVALPLAAAHASVTHTYQLGTSMANYIVAHPGTDVGWVNPTTTGSFAFGLYLISSLTVAGGAITGAGYTGLTRFDTKAATQPSPSYSGTWSTGTPGGATVAAPYLGYSATLFGTPSAVAVTSATQGLGIEFVTQNTNASGQFQVSFTVAANAPVSAYVANVTTGAISAQHNFATGALTYTTILPTSLTVGVPSLGVVIFPNPGATKGSAVAVVETVTD